MPNRCLLRALAAVCLAAAMSHAAQVPRPAPDFTVKLTDGKEIHLNEFKGKVCVMAFILTTCPHCQKTVGFLSTMQNEFGAQGLQVVASAIEDMASMNVPDFIKRFHPPFPVGFNNRDPVLNYLQHPPMLRMLMPQVVFIDRQGTIRAQYAGDDKFFMDGQEQNIRAQIETLIKEGPAPSKKHGGGKSKKSS